MVPYLNPLMDWSRTSRTRTLRTLLWAERFADADVATRLLEESGLSAEAYRRVALMPRLAVQVDDPLPCEILDEVESDARRRFQPGSFEEDDDGVSFTLPSWLAWRPSALHRTPPRDLHVKVRRGLVSAVIDASTGQPLNGDVLNGVRLRRAAPSKRRREAMAARHKSLLATLAALAGRPLQLSEWLYQALADAEAAERRALVVWRTFLETCPIPRSFRVSAPRELSLRDLLLLQAGGRPVLAFADMQPWVTWNILGTASPNDEITFISKDPTRSIGVAARWVCCSAGDADIEATGCPEAMALAKRLSRYRRESALDDLLGKGVRVRRGSTTIDRQIRSILVKAHWDDSELLSHARDFARARRNAEAALRTLFAFRGGRASSVNAAHELAVLALRMGVRERVEPVLDPDTVASGLRAFSADCLAAHFLDETGDGDGADPLDRGVLAFIRFLGSTRRPRMTSRQLARFTDAASRQRVHRVESVDHPDGELLSKWPPPLGWIEGEVRLAGIVARPLLSAEEMLDWGNRVANCLARGWYQDEASTGNQALFALHDEDGEDGTLSLRAVHERRGGKVRVVEWRKDMIYATCNQEATNTHRQAAEELMEQINARCPMEVPAAELQRRVRVTQAREGLRTFNSDPAVARERWQTIYSRPLPRGIAKLPLEEIVRQAHHTLS